MEILILNTVMSQGRVLPAGKVVKTDQANAEDLIRKGFAQKASAGAPEQPAAATPAPSMDAPKPPAGRKGRKKRA